MFPCIYTAITLPWNALFSASSTWKVEDDLEKLGEKLMPLQNFPLFLYQCADIALEYQILFLSGTQQNGSQPHLLFGMAIECEWKLYSSV